MASGQPPEQKTTKPATCKCRWTKDEDEKLTTLVEEHGAKNWKFLAESIPNRTGKQCRERWLCRLSPGQVRDPWTRSEDETLIDLQRKLGNRWAVFRPHLPGRSATAIKNRWTTLKKRGITNLDFEDSKKSIVKFPSLVPLNNLIDLELNLTCEVTITVDITHICL